MGGVWEEDEIGNRGKVTWSLLLELIVIKGFAIWVGSDNAVQ